MTDISALCHAVLKEASQIEAFPVPGIRVRAIRADHYAIADGDAQHAFVDISVRLREGRAAQVKQEAISKIFGAAKDFLGPALATHSIALSAEMRDIDANLSPKYGTIRDHLESKA